jgi:hypothetical protein
MKKSIFTIVLLLILLSTKAQQFDWVKTFSPNASTQCNQILTDKYGNVYSAGQFKDSLLIDTALLINNSQQRTLSSIYILKHDSSGNLIWAKGVHSNYFAIVRSMALDSSDNIYLTGDFGGQVDFDPDPINQYFIGDTINVFSTIETFVCKLSANGVFVWAKSFEQKNVSPLPWFELNRGLSIEIDNNQDVIITGIFTDTVDFDPSSNTFYLNSVYNPLNINSGISNTYLVKLTNDGLLKWVKNFGQLHYVNNYDTDHLEVDSLGNIYLAGTFYDSLSFDSDTGAITIYSVNNISNFICKLDTSGELLWVNSIGSADYDQLIGIDLNQSDNVYLMSRMSSVPYYNSTKITVEGNKSSGNLLAKIKPDGTMERASFITEFNDLGFNSFSINNKGDKLYSTGDFTGKATFNFDSISSLTVNTPTFNQTSKFIYCLDLKQDSSWVKFINGKGGGRSNSLAIDEFSNVYTNGFFNDTVDFNPGNGTEIRASIGGTNTYLHKLSPCTIKKSVKQDTICGADSLVIGNNVYKITGNYIDTYIARDGCDSLVTTQLHVKPLKTDTLKHRFCDGDSVVIKNQTYKTQGYFDYRFPMTDGCDSIFVIEIKVDPIQTTSDTFTICQGDSIQVAQNFYTITGNYQDTLQTQSGCDSIVYTQLTVNSNKITNQSFEVCDGDSIVVGLNTYKVSGNYTDTFLTHLGCDSLVNTTLLVNQQKIVNQNIVLCFGEGIAIGDNVYTNSGAYQDTLQASNGCDSIISTNLSISPKIETSQSVHLCLSDSIIIGSKFYSNPGTYTDTLSSILGCDSIINTLITKADPSIDTTLFNSLLSNDTVASYQWLDCDNNYAPITGATNRLFTYYRSGVYALQLTYYNCIDITDCYRRELQSFESDVFKIYPNPSNGNFKVEVTNFGELNFYDSKGKFVSSLNCTPGINEFSMYSLANGMYILRFISGSKVLTKKLVISK